MLDRALKFAREKHDGQKRKGNKEYIEHPISVCKRLQDIGVIDENILCSSLLHDTLEDTETKETELENLFGIKIQKIVSELSSDNKEIEYLGNEQYKKWLIDPDTCETSSIVVQLNKYYPSISSEKVKKRQGKSLYLSYKLSKISSEAKLIKLADRLDNISDIFTLVKSSSDSTENRQFQKDMEFLMEYFCETQFLITTLTSTNILSSHLDYYSSLVASLNFVLSDINYYLAK